MTKESCRQALERVYEYLDGELPAEDAAHIQQHFERCKACYPVLQYCQSFQEALARAASCQGCAPDDLKLKIQELLKEN
ncbi:MAG TPA: zf-HC2 domain-containing protein [Longimicrobiales bacterium]